MITLEKLSTQYLDPDDVAASWSAKSASSLGLGAGGLQRVEPVCLKIKDEDTLFYWGGHIGGEPQDSGVTIPVNDTMSSPTTTITSQDPVFSGTAVSFKTSTKNYVVIVGGLAYDSSSGAYSMSDILYYDVDTDTWGTISFPSGFSSRFTPVVTQIPGDRLFIFGGWLEGRPQSNGIILDLKNLEWVLLKTDEGIPELGSGNALALTFKTSPSHVDGTWTGEVLKVVASSNTQTSFTETTTYLHPMADSVEGSTTIDGNPYNFYDADGVLYENVTNDEIGTIDYDTGEINLEFPAAPEANIVLDYLTSSTKVWILNGKERSRGAPKESLVYDTWKNLLSAVDSTTLENYEDLPEKRTTPFSPVGEDSSYTYSAFLGGRDAELPEYLTDGGVFYSYEDKLYYAPLEPEPSAFAYVYGFYPFDAHYAPDDEFLTVFGTVRKWYTEGVKRHEFEEGNEILVLLYNFSTGLTRTVRLVSSNIRPIVTGNRVFVFEGTAPNTHNFVLLGGNVSGGNPDATGYECGLSDDLHYVNLSL